MRVDQLRGHLYALVLAVLAAGPAHGYSVIVRLRERSRTITLDPCAGPAASTANTNASRCPRSWSPLIPRQLRRPSFGRQPLWQRCGRLERPAADPDDRQRGECEDKRSGHLPMVPVNLPGAPCAAPPVLGVGPP